MSATSSGLRPVRWYESLGGRSSPWAMAGSIAVLLLMALLPVSGPGSDLAGPKLLAAQENGNDDWDVTEARGEVVDLDFEVDEGTWLSVDLSPDGEWVVFDLLGHIYRIPAEGGRAELLTTESGVSLNYHPRYSPDGRHIAFISDRAGQDNLWMMQADGSEPTAVFTSQDVRATQPTWSPDGEYLFVRRNSLAPGPGGSGIWMYHRDGGTGVSVVSDGNPRWPSVSPDGRHLYYHVVEGGRDALSGHYQLRRLDLSSGESLELTFGGTGGAASGRVSSGGAFAPEVSPDGRWLAFARQVPYGTVNYRGHSFGPRTALWLRDLETGSERMIMDPISIAVESGSKNIRIIPGYGWSADGESIVLWQGGQVRRLEVASGEVATIPFQARVQRTISEQAYQSFRIYDEPFRARFLRWHTASPDGDRLAFQAVGRIWIQDLPNGTPRRLTPEGFGPWEYGPTWSPDGEWIAFTSRDEIGRGDLWRISVDGGAPERLSPESGEYVHPSWRPDGGEIVVARGAGATERGRTFTHNPWWDVVRVPIDSGDPVRVARITSPGTQARRSILHPSYGPDDRIYFPALRRGDQGMETAVHSVRPDGLDQRTHLILPYADEVVPSPDGRRYAFQEGDNIWVASFPSIGVGGAEETVQKRRGQFPVQQISEEGGLFPRWRDASTLEFGSADRYYRHDLDTGTADTVEVDLQVDRRLPTGSIALTGARILTMTPGNEVIERGDLIVEGSRIVCVGDCAVDEADEVIDATGTTLMPGLIDMHSHHYREHRGYRPQIDYEVAVYLAYGVTTSLDNSMWSQNIFPTAELIDAGLMVGPRTYSSGDPLYRGDAARQNELSSLQETRAAVRRLSSWGAVSLKQYMQPRRDQRQWVSHVAREEGLMVTAEGGDLFYNLGMIMDGQTAWEHTMSEAPIYSDVARFLGEAKAVYSNPFIVAGLGPWNIEYFFAEDDVWEHPLQQRFMPWRMTAGHLRRRTLRPDTDYSFPLIAEALGDIIAHGGYGAIGSHGEHHGPGPHWEIWMAASGLGEMGALDLATRQGAYFLGADGDLGTLEVGKLADLIVLNSNPLENIRSTMDLRYVMKGGIMYESETLDEVWPEARTFGPYYWVDEDALRSDDRPMDWWDREGR